jgi:hypothetical protein
MGAGLVMQPAHFGIEETLLKAATEAHLRSRMFQVGMDRQ